METDIESHRKPSLYLKLTQEGDAKRSPAMDSSPLSDHMFARVHFLHETSEVNKFLGLLQLDVLWRPAESSVQELAETVQEGFRTELRGSISSWEEGIFPSQVSLLP